MKTRILLLVTLCTLMAVSSAIAAAPQEQAQSPEVALPGPTLSPGPAEAPAGDIITSPVLDLIGVSSPDAVSCVACIDYIDDYKCYKYCLSIGAGSGGACTFGCCECL